MDLPMCSYDCASFGRRNRSNISFTFVQENIMSIIGDTTKHSICAPGVAFVDFLGLDIKPEFMCRNRFIVSLTGNLTFTTKIKKWFELHL